MNIYTEDEALIELLEVGCTNDKRYKRLPKDVIKGYIKAYNHLRAAKRIEDLFRIGSLHYERLKKLEVKIFRSVPLPLNGCRNARNFGQRQKAFLQSVCT